MISKSITKEQVLETMYEDGTTYRRDVYTGPQGSGYTDIWTKMVGEVKWIKCEHVGVEDRESFDWKIDGDK